MKKIIALELHGLQVPRSMKIKYINDIDLFIYPKDLFNLIDHFDNIIQDLDTSDVESNTIRVNNTLKFDVGNDKYSYLFCEFSTDFYDETSVIIQRIIDFFEVFLQVNTFLFKFFISISRIFFIEKVGSVFRLIRVIEQNIRINRNIRDFSPYKCERYEQELSTLFSRINNSELLKEMIKLFYEYGAANDTETLQVQFSLLWNYLEHVINLYANNVNKNLIIEQTAFERVKEQISEILDSILETAFLVPINMDYVNSEIGRVLNKLNEDSSFPLDNGSRRSLKNQIRNTINNQIQDEEILIEGYDKDKIYELLIQKITQFPPIKELVRLVLRDINYRLTPREILNLEIIYAARNHFYHHSVDLESLYQSIISDHNEITQFNLISLKQEIRYFNKFLRKITGILFKKMFFESLKNKSLIVSYWDQHSITGESNANEYFINKVKNVRDNLWQEKKYLLLHKFLLKKVDNYEENFNTLQDIEGICFEVDHQEPISFQLNFEDKFRAHGTFQGGIGYPKVYNFFIDLRTILDNFPSILRFTELIYMSFSSNIHEIHIRILDYWSNYERVIEHFDYLRENHQ